MSIFPEVHCDSKNWGLRALMSLTQKWLAFLLALLLLQVTNDRCSARRRAATVDQMFSRCHGSTSPTSVSRVFAAKKIKENPKIKPNVLWDVSACRLIGAVTHDWTRLLCLVWRWRQRGEGERPQTQQPEEPEGWVRTGNQAFSLMSIEIQ